MTSMAKNYNSLGLYKRLLKYTLKYKVILFFSLIAVGFAGLTEASLAALLKPILDQGFIGKDAFFIKMMPFMIVGAFLVMSGFSYIGNVGMQKIAQNVILNLRGQMFQKLLTIPIQRFDDQPSGVLLSKLTYDVNQLLTISSFALVTLIKDSATILGLLTVMLYSDWKLTLIALCAGPFIALILRFVSKRLRTLSHNIQNEMGELNHVVEETIRGHKEIRLYNAADAMNTRFNKTNSRLMKLNIRTMIISELSSPATQLMVVLFVAAFIAYAGNQVAQAQLTVGGFLSLLAAMVMLLNPIKRLTRLNESLQRGLAGATSIFALLDECDELSATTRITERFKGEIKITNLDFNYGERVALKDINLHIQAGQTAALVGASGSGKTTLANLIARFYLPDTGSIVIDGHDISDIHLDDFRKNISYVSQNVVLFAGNISDNIALGQTNLNTADILQSIDKAINKAIENANAAEFIRQLPARLNTLIGENGTRLSGGQRQRLAIARAFLKDAPILILDEATSNLDTQSEFLIQQAMENLSKNRTTIIIAHRLSTIEKADIIVVLDHGKIVETGNHEQLIAKNGAYAKLHRIGDYESDT
ncbi:lipid ABC transporter permease/ATPase [Gammaproteobacteria bacterium]|nr:lipid ABC transporter permease/ATPase [Gammaproteobacteria bacterium]